MMSLKSLEQRKLLGFLKSIDKELASTNRKNKKLNLLITKLRGSFACALACVRDFSEISIWGGWWKHGECHNFEKRERSLKIGR